MDFIAPLERTRLIRRYKRFLADVERADGSTLTVHCANPGSMLGLAEPGFGAFISDSGNPKRKLRHSLELIETGDGTLVNINTGAVNRLAEEAIRAGAVPSLTGFSSLKAEVAYGTGSRVDFLLTFPDQAPTYVEVKSVTLSRAPGLAEFPDSVTARGLKHLDELARVVANGERAMMLFLVQRSDCTRFQAAGDLDPRYAAGLARAMEAGVEIVCLGCMIDKGSIRVDAPIEIVA
ncbi:MAG: DNA/RNA nuclease SfsA [Parvibaculaceae bacterium]|nr:DNA/RNA nuclease SfsA [Parvibaculaceae bacterium]